MLKALLLFLDPFNKQTYLKKKSPATKKSTDFIQKVFLKLFGSHGHLSYAPCTSCIPPWLPREHISWILIRVQVSKVMKIIFWFLFPDDFSLLLFLHLFLFFFPFFHFSFVGQEDNKMKLSDTPSVKTNRFPQSKLDSPGKLERDRQDDSSSCTDIQEETLSSSESDSFKR